MTPEKLAALAELLPCPFCGGKAEIERKGDHYRSTVYQCTDCGCNLETGEEWEHGQRWNTRALPQGYAAGVEAAAKYHDDAAIKLRKHMKRFSNEDYSCVASEEAAAHETHATAIRSLSSADAVVEGWRGIESAPKDGTYVILKFTGPFHDAESLGVAIGRYYPRDQKWWVTCIWAGSTVHTEPSGWQPLPTPPAVRGT